MYNLYHLYLLRFQNFFLFVHKQDLISLFFLLLYILLYYFRCFLLQINHMLFPDFYLLFELYMFHHALLIFLLYLHSLILLFYHFLASILQMHILPLYLLLLVLKVFYLHNLNFLFFVLLFHLQHILLCISDLLLYPHTLLVICNMLHLLMQLLVNNRLYDFSRLLHMYILHFPFLHMINLYYLALMYLLRNILHYRLYFFLYHVTAVLLQFYLCSCRILVSTHHTFQNIVLLLPFHFHHKVQVTLCFSHNIQLFFHLMHEYRYTCYLMLFVLNLHLNLQALLKQ